MSQPDNRYNRLFLVMIIFGIFFTIKTCTTYYILQYNVHSDKEIFSYPLSFDTTAWSAYTHYSSFGT